MAKKRPITFMVDEYELSTIDQLAMLLSSDRSKVIRLAIKHFEPEKIFNKISIKRYHGGPFPKQ